MTLLQRFAITSLVVFVALGIVIAYFLGQTVQDNALSSARQSASDSLVSGVFRYIQSSDFSLPMRDGRYRAFRRYLHDSVLSVRTVRVKLWNREGMVIYSDDPRLLGRRFPVDDGLGDALRGQLSSDVSDLHAAENLDERSYGQLLEVYVPIRRSPHGGVVGAFELYQAYGPVAQNIASVQRSVYAMLAAGLFLLYLMLFGVVRNGSKIIVTQQGQLQRYTNDLEQSYKHTISSLAAAVEARDSSTEKHAERVTALAVEFGRWIGLSEPELRVLEHGAMLHDVGKIGVSDNILLKPDCLTEDEWEIMREHPVIGYNMLSGIEFLEPVLPLVLHHHERWDGTGYPHGLRDADIPLQARLFAIIDAFDAITSDRPYRPAASPVIALDRLRAGSGTHFDPLLVAAFEDMWRIKYRDAFELDYSHLAAASAHSAAG